MELVVEPDIYTPSMNDVGVYIDKIPSFNTLKKGLTCPCGTRKDKVYEKQSVFAIHIKSQTHQKWLETVNLNKANQYIENIKLKDTVQNQQHIIARMEKEINTRNMTIEYLTLELNRKTYIHNTVNTLLDMD